MMGFYKNIIKADYLQRTRSYTFLITLLVSVYIAKSFIPPSDANYSTVRIGNYIGNNNAAWIGHVTAVMGSTFLWLFGFYLVSSGIKRDKETGVGQIIAATSVSNFGYLCAKAFSNFCVLLTILLIIILMAAGIYIFRGEPGSFSLSQFLLPYLFAAIPSLFLVSVLAILFEVLFGSNTNLLNITFFLLFGVMLGVTNQIQNPMLLGLDPLGVKFITSSMVKTVENQYSHTPQGISVGFIFGQKALFKYFEFKGTQWSALYILSRVMWLAVSFGLLFVASKIFNRFDSRSVIKLRRKKDMAAFPVKETSIRAKEIQLADIPRAGSDFSIYPLVKAEVKMLIRKGPLWFWLLNFGGMASLLFLPISGAHQIGLPILWMFQINRWADIAVKEKFYQTHFFMFSAFKPLQRLLASQLIAAFVLALFLALPLIIRFLMLGSFYEPVAIIIGAMLLIASAACCGILSGGKRLFEILFFLLTYALVSGAGFLDYTGALNHSTSYLLLISLILSVMLALVFVIRKHEIVNQ